MSLKLVENPKKAKVLQFERPPGIVDEILHRLREQIANNEISEFIVTWVHKDTPTNCESYWFSESTLRAMGLVQRMMDQINRWCNGEIEG